MRGGPNFGPPFGSVSSSIMQLSSPDFGAGQSIPARFTCEGEDVSPALVWGEVPAGAKSLALIVEDPDAPDPRAPKRIYTHWVVYDLPPSSRGLPGGTSELPAGTREGKNDWGRTGYGGPCPPVGRHRYFFRLHALDSVLPDLGQPTRAELLGAMEGHVLETAELMGTYQKER
jgi:Raf kinase inhibitor-like YbhB/YbcL family protein